MSIDISNSEIIRSQLQKHLGCDYFDVDKISRLARVDDAKGKFLWDLMLEAIHQANKAEIEKQFPKRVLPF